VTDPSAPGKLAEDWWNPAKRLLSDAALVKKLVAYATPGLPSSGATGGGEKGATSDSEQHPPAAEEASAAAGGALTAAQKEKAVETVRKKHLQHPDFNPKKVEQASTAAKGSNYFFFISTCS
jgi:hypothetical protein